MKLIVNGTQEFLGKEIPVIEGGFGEGQRCILAKDIAIIHETHSFKVNELIKNNIDEFEEGVDILEILGILKSIPKLAESMGISKDSMNSLVGKNGKVYMLSESGHLTLCMLMRTERSKKLRRQFRKQYFAMRASLASQAEYIKILEQHKCLLENNERLVAENAKLTSKNNELNERIYTSCEIPKKHLVKDVKVFLSEYTSNAIFGRVYKDEMFAIYLWSKKTRKEQPTRIQFEDVMSELGHLSDNDSWLDIIWK